MLYDESQPDIKAPGSLTCSAYNTSSLRHFQKLHRVSVDSVSHSMLAMLTISFIVRCSTERFMFFMPFILSCSASRKQFSSSNECWFPIFICTAISSFSLLILNTIIIIVLPPNYLSFYLVFSADQNGQFDRFERFYVPLAICYPVSAAL